MRSEGELSKTMKAAMAAARDNGGIIRRFPGGFWGHNGMDRQRPWFGTTTIQALVSRGFLEYSEWHEGTSRFPIAAALPKEPVEERQP